MNRVVVSLLKGRNEDKLNLLNNNLSFNELLTICNSQDLKQIFRLEKGYNFNRLQEILELVEKLKIDLVCFKDSNYPKLLNDIFDPPFLLYTRGDLDNLSKSMISVVGTRKPSLKGHHEAFKVGLDLGREGVGVISGLAMGVDGSAHLGNLLSGGKSVAVLGNGVDTIYPKSNKGLAGDILKTGGTIVSEFPPGETPKAFNFPKRNRIIAGLSRKLLIIQAPKKSGALITGDYALDNGGDIFVHSVGISDNRFLGSDKYYKDGAIKIDSALPLLKSLGKSPVIPEFNSDSYSKEELISLEIKGSITKFKGCYYCL